MAKPSKLEPLSKLVYPVCWNYIDPGMARLSNASVSPDPLTAIKWPPICKLENEGDAIVTIEDPEDASSDISSSVSTRGACISLNCI